MEMKHEELNDLIIKWAKQKGLLIPLNYKAQFMKVIEEIGELSSAILKGDENGEIDAFGDVMVTLIILSAQRGFDLTECLEHAYNEIKDRTGKMKNGTFIKD
jgi:NTP pyrophosphatase (non-canonical NTP hydrolase)